MTDLLRGDRTLASPRATFWSRTAGAASEIFLLVCLWIVFAGGAAPDINEAHYLTKARHYWNPTWCQRDVFLRSADAHAVFFLTFGWLTQFCSLATTANLGRLVGWTLLAIGWRSLSRAVVPGRLTSLLTAAWFLILLEHGHMAGEWVVGGIEAKVPAYGFVLLGLAALAANNWRGAWLWFGCGGLFHVLVGGWSFVAALFAWWCTPRTQRLPLREMWPWVVAGGLLALPSILIGLSLQRGDVDADTASIADRILVYRRLGHHLAFHQFPRLYMARFAALVAVTLLLTRGLRFRHVRFARLWTFAVGALSIAAMGIAIDQTLLNRPGPAAALLKFYWFRLADVLVPVTLAAALVLWLQQWQARRPAGWLLLVLIAIPLAVLGTRVRARLENPRPPADHVLERSTNTPAQAQRKFENWRTVCRWIKEHTSADDIFLTPRDQQTFKWYAERAEVVSWKDVPQDAASIIDWRIRWRSIYSAAAARYGVSAWSDQQLAEKMAAYQARFVVVERPRLRRMLGPPFRQVYPTMLDENVDFAVYELGLLR